MFDALVVIILVYWSFITCKILAYTLSLFLLRVKQHSFLMFLKRKPESHCHAPVRPLVGWFALPNGQIAPSKGRIASLWWIRPFITIHLCNFFVLKLVFVTIILIKRMRGTRLCARFIFICLNDQVFTWISGRNIALHVLKFLQKNMFA